MFYFLQEHYGKFIIQEKEKQDSKKGMQVFKCSRNNIGQEVKCKLTSPICIEYMENFGKAKRKELFFVFRISDFPYSNPNYFTKNFIHTHFKDKKSKPIKPLDKLPNRRYAFINLHVFDDKVAAQNKMRIGRQDHICRDNVKIQIFKNKLISSVKSPEKNLEAKDHPRPKLKEEFTEYNTFCNDKFSKALNSGEKECPPKKINKNKISNGLLMINNTHKMVNIINIKTPKRSLNGNIFNLPDKKSSNNIDSSHQEILSSADLFNEEHKASVD